MPAVAGTTYATGRMNSAIRSSERTNPPNRNVKRRVSIENWIAWESDRAQPAMTNPSPSEATTRSARTAAVHPHPAATGTPNP